MINTQTAIEWLIDQLIQLDKELDGRRKNQDSTVLKLNPTDLYEKAKQMEKEQIQMAFNDGKVNSVLKKRDSEEYYQETYGKKEEDNR